MSETDELTLLEISQSQALHFMKQISDAEFVERKEEESLKLSAFSLKTILTNKLECPPGLENFRDDLVKWRETTAKFHYEGLHFVASDELIEEILKEGKKT